jgi:hypothetical protein
VTKPDGRQERLGPDDPAFEALLREEMKRLYGSVEVWPEVRERAAAAAERAHDSPPSGGGLARRSAGLMLALVVVVAAVMGLRPRRAAAGLMGDVQRAVSAVRSAQITYWEVFPDGRRRWSTEVWFDRGRWRTEDRFGISIAARGTVSEYDRSWHLLRARPGTAPFAKPVTGLTLSHLLADGEAEMALRTVREVPTGIGGPAKLLEAQIDHPTMPETMTMWVDPGTMLPLRWEAHSLRPDVKHYTYVETRYNEPLPDRLFEPEKPGTAAPIPAG